MGLLDGLSGRTLIAFLQSQMSSDASDQSELAGRSTESIVW